MTAESHLLFCHSGKLPHALADFFLLKGAVKPEFSDLGLAIPGHKLLVADGGGLSCCPVTYTSRRPGKLVPSSPVRGAVLVLNPGRAPLLTPARPDRDGSGE